jgi:hypothetical protein
MVAFKQRVFVEKMRARVASSNESAGQ